METFKFIWNLLEGHGSTSYHKAEAAELWENYTVEEQRAIFRKIRDKVNEKKFVHFNPVRAILENAPQRVVAAPHLLSTAEQTRNLEDGVAMAVVKYQGRFPVVTKAEAIRYGMEVTREF